MDVRRLIQSIRFFFFFDQMKRADYARRKHIFHHVGNNVRLPAMLVPLHAELISFHDNVEIASGVKFIAHDAIHGVLNFKYNGEKNNPEFPEQIDCIEIMDNVFVGSGTILLGGVRIGSDVIIGANSLVNKDVPNGSVYAGSPAKKIGEFEDVVKKRRNVVACESTDAYWRQFEEKHK